MMVKYLSAVLVLLCACSALATEYCINSVASDVIAPYLESGQPGKHRYKKYAHEILKDSLNATIKRSSVMLDDTAGRSYKFTYFYSRFRSPRTSELGELEDDWLYVRGGDYYYVFQMVESEFGLWAPGKRFGFASESGLFDRLIGVLFGWSRYKSGGFDVKEVEFTKDKPIYSDALKRLLFLQDNLIWRNGKLVHEDFRDATKYIGDNPKLKVAYLKDEQGQLWALNDRGLSKVIDGRTERGIHHFVLGRSFYTAHKGIYEIIKEGNSFRLVSIELPGLVEDFFATEFVPAPDESTIFVLQRQGVHDLRSLANVFTDKTSDERVHITGSNKHPALFPDLGGVLFSAGPTYDDAEFFLIEACSAAKANPALLKLKGYRRLVDTYIQAFERTLTDENFKLLKIEQDNWRHGLASSCSSQNLDCEAERYRARYVDLQDKFIATRPWYIQESGVYVQSPSYCSFAGKLIPEDALVLAGGAYESSRLGPIRENARGTFDLVVYYDSRPLVLLLSAYEPATWRMHVPADTQITAIFLTGFHPQKIQGLPAGTPVLYSDYKNGRCGTTYVDLDDESKVQALAKHLFGRQASVIKSAAKGRLNFFDDRSGQAPSGRRVPDGGRATDISSVTADLTP